MEFSFRNWKQAGAAALCLGGMFSAFAFMQISGPDSLKNILPSPPEQGWYQEKNDWVYYVQSKEKLTDTWAEIDGYHYFFDKDGKMVTGWIKWEGDLYYTDSLGILQTGWISFQDKWYYLDLQGRMQTGWLHLPEGDYYLEEESGRMIREGWHTLEDGTACHFDSDGRMDLISSVGAPEPALEARGVVLGKTESSPMPFENLGWLIRRQGCYGFYTPQGQWLLPAQYQKAAFSQDGLQIAFAWQEGWDTLLDATGAHPVPASGFSADEKSFLIMEEDSKTFVNMDGSAADLQENRAYVVLEKQADGTLKQDSFSLWMPGSSQLAGPFDAASFECWSMNLEQEETGFDIHQMPISLAGCYARKEVDGTWTLVSVQTGEETGGFRSVSFLSGQTAIAWKTDFYFEVYDGALQLLYTSRSVPNLLLQNAAGLVDGKALVQYNDIWYLIELD